MSIDLYRQADYPINPLFLNRWSQRALSGEPIPDEVLFTFLEAARWSPSGGNTQPWRFLYAKRDSSHWADFLGLLNERNQSWAQRASALVLVLSARTRNTQGGSAPLRSHSFDTGAAWSALALQARLSGWSARGIGGFDHERARELLHVPDNYQVEIAIAIGRPADKSVLPEALREAEQPTIRLPLKDLVAEGRFNFA